MSSKAMADIRWAEPCGLERACGAAVAFLPEARQSFLLRLGEWQSKLPLPAFLLPPWEQLAEFRNGLINLIKHPPPLFERHCQVDSHGHRSLQFQFDDGPDCCLVSTHPDGPVGGTGRRKKSGIIRSSGCSSSSTGRLDSTRCMVFLRRMYGGADLVNGCLIARPDLIPVGGLFDPLWMKYNLDRLKRGRQA
jgi:hypothetical protein